MARGKNKRGYATDVVGRLLETLKLIPQSGRITARDLKRLLAERGFEVDYRTTQRDLERLERVGFLARDDRSVPHGWNWIDGEAKKSLGLPINTALVLKLAYEHVKPLMPVSLLKELKALADFAEKSLASSAGRNLFAKWPDKVRVLENGPPRTPPRIAAEVHSAVCEALLKNLRLRVNYRAASRDEAREFVVTPLGLVSKNGIIYLVVSREDKSEPATFSLHRIVDATVEYIDGKSPDKWNGLGSYIDAGKFLFPPAQIEKDQWITLRIHSEVIKRGFEEMAIGRSQTIKKTLQKGKHFYLLRGRIDISEEFVRWLLQYGDHVEVVKPDLLRKRMKSIVASLSSRYQMP